MKFINKENDLTIFLNIIDDIVHTLKIPTETVPATTFIKSSSRTRILASFKVELDQKLRWANRELRQFYQLSIPSSRRLFFVLRLRT